MNYGPISFEGKTVNGSPVFEGTNVPIQNLFEYLEDGKSMEKFLEDYPAVSKKMAVEVIQMAKLVLANEKILKENFSSK
jgi:uncharacterized protein (DUF433 family)